MQQRECSLFISTRHAAALTAYDVRVQEAHVGHRAIKKKKVISYHIRRLFTFCWLLVDTPNTFFLSSPPLPRLVSADEESVEEDLCISKPLSVIPVLVFHR